MCDFNLTAYKKLLAELLKAEYGFVTFAEYIQDPDKKEKTLILRHDVDKKPLQALRTAEMENELGINGTYYFRVIKDKLPKEVIARIAKMGHEIGYHYDDLNIAGGVVAAALDLFRANLARLRELAPIKTACMHGSPLSRHDNRDLWKHADYREFGIVGEPYFDIDFTKVLYLTDTGRRWDGEKVNIRDKVGGQRSEVRSERSEGIGQKAKGREDKEKRSRGVVCDSPIFNLHSTGDILKALKENLLPNKIMLTIHPQRWTDRWLSWIWELCWQKVKNCVKYFMAKKADSNQ